MTFGKCCHCKMLNLLQKNVTALFIFSCLLSVALTLPTNDINILPKTIKITPCDPSFGEGLLKLHNLIRERHSAPPLLLNSNMSLLAQMWSDEVARVGFLKHRPNRKMGENLYSARLLSPRRLYPSQPMDLWYGERVRYCWYGQEPNLTYFNDWGHFTALVWRATRLVGIGCAMEISEVVRGVKGKYTTSTSKSVYVTVNFYPKGNVVSRFADNVRPAREEVQQVGSDYYDNDQTSYQRTTSPAPYYHYSTKGTTKGTTQAGKTTQYYSTTTAPTYPETPRKTTKKLSTPYYTKPRTTSTLEPTYPETTTEERTTTELSTPEYETETSTTPPVTTDKYTERPTSHLPPPPPPCNQYSYNYGQMHQVPHLQPPPPLPPISYPIDFTDPDDFEDFLKTDSKNSKSSSSSATR